MGTDNRSAVGTLVERTSRYLLLLHLPGGRDALNRPGVSGDFLV
jgi:transposase, IS30 family